MGRRFEEVTEEAKLVPYKVVAGPNGDARVDIDGKQSQPAGDLRAGPAQAEARRRELPRREGHRGGHHRPGLLQRRPAPGHQGRRRDRRPDRQAHRQRAHRGGAGLRPRQEEGREDRRLRLRRRHLRHLDPRGRRERGRGARHQRRHAPRRRQHRPADHGLADRRVQEGQRHRRLQGQDGPAAPQGGGGEGEDRALQHAWRRRSTCRSSPPTQTGPKHLNVKLTRAKFESMIEDLIERSLEPCRKCLKDAGLRGQGPRRGGAGRRLAPASPRCRRR